jgi:hypothetical protein
MPTQSNCFLHTHLILFLRFDFFFLLSFFSFLYISPLSLTPSRLTLL